jgi:hypothetical protein
MTDDRKAEEHVEHDEKVEDLDVPMDEGEDVKGGSRDGTSNTLMRGCATGKHISKADITL